MTFANPRTCRATDQFASAECTSVKSADLAKDFSCALRNAAGLYFVDKVRLNQTDCSCVDSISGGVTSQICQCCAPRAAIAVRGPTCNVNTTTSQACDCKNVFNPATNNFGLVCDCNRRVNNTTQLRTGVRIEREQCSCLNQTLAGQANTLNCTCCVPNPPLPFCQQLAQQNNTNLNCRCNYILVNGVSTFTCDCSARVNTTHTLTRSQMLLDENSCCCTDRTDPITRLGFKSCNCTQPATFQTQRCQCKPVGNAANSTQVTCNCSDCNNVITSARTLPNSRCSCPSFGTSINQSQVTNGTIRTANGTNATTNATTSSNMTGNTTGGNRTTNATTTNATA